MWKKNILWLLAGMFLLAFPAFAYDLTLTKIGTLSTIGADYSLVNYLGAVPALEGTATPAATVSVKVNSVINSVITATSSGVWNFTPASLDVGDNLITITSGTQSIVFTIRYSVAAPTATPSAAVTSLPETGTWENIVYGVLAGGVIWFLGRVVKKKMRLWEGRG